MKRLFFACSVFLTLPMLSVSADAQELPFTGQSLDGWTTLDGKPVSAGWTVEDGVLHLKSTKGNRGGHIITRQDFENFELTFEFKIAKKGNSGIKYRVRDFDGKTLGCEYQIFDDTVGKKQAPNKRTASLYDVYEPKPAGLFKPNKFNTGKIVVFNNHIEHWLNGQKVVDIQVADSEWFERVGKSKFKNVQGFGQTPFGRIMLTDHNSEAWYRNLRLRLLTPQYLPPSNAAVEPATGGIVKVKKP